jgi:hypothetical protein
MNVLLDDGAVIADRYLVVTFKDGRVQRLGPYAAALADEFRRSVQKLDAVASVRIKAIA